MGASFYSTNDQRAAGMVHCILFLKLLLSGEKKFKDPLGFESNVKDIVDKIIDESEQREWYRKYSEIGGIVLEDPPHWGRLLVLVITTKCFGEATGLSTDCLVSWLTAVLYESKTTDFEIPDYCFEQVWSRKCWWFVILHFLILVYMFV